MASVETPGCRKLVGEEPSPPEKRSMTISIELAPDEDQKLEEKARGRGQVVSDYVRELIRKELNGGPRN